MNPLIPTIAISLFIAVQDFRYRRVYWFLFPILFCSGLYFARLKNDPFWMQNLLQNSLFLGLVLSLLLSYFFLKYKSLQSIKDQIGLGDVLLFIAILPFFKTEEFALFFSLSLFLSLLFFLPFIIRKKDFKIPLAGFQSLIFALVLGFSFADIQVLPFLKALLI